MTSPSSIAATAARNCASTVRTSSITCRFSDAVDDIVDARIYEGVHFRSADEVARRGESRTRRQPDVKPFPPAAPLECETGARPDGMREN
jgi:hypothetical protein